MKKLFTLGLLVLLIGTSGFGQQDAQFTKYMFNSLVFNPAYAGSKEHMSVSLIHRTQWWGIEGAPQTQAATFHTPMADRVGVGLSLVNDAIGPTNTLAAYASYAYRIPMGENGKLSIGLQGGMVNWRADWKKLNLEDVTDVSFDATPNMFLPNFGVGTMYYSDKFYVGVGIPHLIEHDLREMNDISSVKNAKMYRHIFFNMGGAIPLSDGLIFRPSMMIKNVGLFSKFKTNSADPGAVPEFEINAPTSFDVDLSLFIKETLWIGAAYRSSFEAFTDDSTNDSVDAWVAWYLKNGLRIGFAYDYTLTKLRQPAGGSFEVMLGYEFIYKSKKIVTPRYF